MVIPIARKYEKTGDDVMGEHLVVVFPPLLNIDYYNLLKPECKLHKIIPFKQAIELSVGPVNPEFTEVEPVALIVHQVLFGRSVATSQIVGAVILTIPSDKKAV